MEYTVHKLAALSGISTRTLRYYDELGILKPARINSSGYRIYGKTEIDRLQQILFYKELDVPLETIREILSAPDFNITEALNAHHRKLLEKRTQLDLLINTLELTILSKEGRTTMTDAEKFEGFKQKLVDENETKYGKEVRSAFGDEAVNASNEMFLNRTQAEQDAFSRLTEELMATLSQAMETKDPGSKMAQKAAQLHKDWLMFHWSQYSAEAHAGLARMYVDDERFKSYYDAVRPGTAEFLRDAVLIFTMKK